MSQSIAITGSGIICSIGVNKDSVLKSLLENRSGISSVEYLATEHKELPVGEVKMTNDAMKQQLDVSADEDVSRTSLLGAIALKQALAEANIDAAKIGANRKVVFISGTTVGGMDVTERHYSHMEDAEDEVAYVTQHDCGSNSEEIARLCGLDCKVITISTACSSALNAIILGAKMLLTGEADLVLAGGSEALSRFHLNGFNSLMILDSERCRPFDKSRRGLNLGEGAAYVVLERPGDAKNRDIEALGYIGGYGNRCDAFHQTATSPGGEGALLAMEDAISMSGLKLDEIDYINAHGTGTPDNDRSESAAVCRLFGDTIPPMSSTKSFTGHTTSASGSIESVISLMAMHKGFVPANLGWAESDEDCIKPSCGAVPKEIHNVLCNSFGFGGNDSSLLISDCPISLTEFTVESHNIVGENEVTDDEALKELREFVSPMESRRMSKVMKASLLTAMRALQQAGIDTPDAIVVATRYGMLGQGEKILDHIEQVGEDGLSPTLFMQSTHNTIAGFLAIRLKCHGFNITYSQGSESMNLAIEDANRVISEGVARNVLVVNFDECPPKFKNIMHKAGVDVPYELQAKSMIISRNK